jgi:hypothetical protein
MSNLHLPRMSAHFSEMFHHSDPNAWIVLVLAICSLAAIFSVLVFR